MKFKYELRRSASRKTIGICIKADNSIVVSAPLHTKIDKIERFLEEKSGWIEGHIAKNSAINCEFSDVLEGKALLVKGAPVPYFAADKSYFGYDKICAPTFAKLKKLYVDNLGGQFFEKLDYLCARTHLDYATASFRSYKSRWGCCDRKKNLSFNYKILMLPENLWDYVIVHELCHTLHMDHSKAFRQCVGRYLPNYKKSVKEIKRYSFLCPMY